MHQVTHQRKGQSAMTVPNGDIGSERVKGPFLRDADHFVHQQTNRQTLQNLYTQTFSLMWYKLRISFEKWKNSVATFIAHQTTSEWQGKFIKDKQTHLYTT